MIDSCSELCLLDNYILSLIIRGLIIHVTMATVFSTDPANITESPANLTVNQSFSAEFSCTAFGNPIPQIVWSRDDTELSDNVDTISVFSMVNDIQYTITSILLINSAMRSRDVGMYNCTAVNNVPNNINADNIQIAELVVQGKLFSLTLTCQPLLLLYNLVPPVVAPVNPTVIGVEGEEAVLAFNVFNAFPPVTIDNVRWLLNRKGIITDITNNAMVDNNMLRFEINSTTQMYSLTISDIQPNYTSRFNLTVRNSAGTHTDFIDFIVEGILKDCSL